MAQTTDTHRALAPDEPRLDRARGPLEADELAGIGAEEVTECGIVEGHPLAAADLELSTWRELVLRQVRLTDAQLGRASWSDLELDTCDLVGAEARAMALHRVRITGSRMAGMLLGEATLRHVVLERCQLDGARLRAASLGRVVLRECSLAGADLSGARLESVVFEDCDLTGSRWFDTRMQRCELRGCTLDGLEDVARLDGVAMPLLDVVDQAPLLARLLGVHVLQGE